LRSYLSRIGTLQSISSLAIVKKLDPEYEIGKKPFVLLSINWFYKILHCLFRVITEVFFIIGVVVGNKGSEEKIGNQIE
jgi:hypothetical protein